MNLQPWEWARATAAHTPESFERRVNRCDSIEYLRAAVSYEANRNKGYRQDRIATLNQAIASLQ